MDSATDYLPKEIVMYFYMRVGHCKLGKKGLFAVSFSRLPVHLNIGGLASILAHILHTVFIFNLGRKHLP